MADTLHIPGPTAARDALRARPPLSRLIRSTPSRLWPWCALRRLSLRERVCRLIADDRRRP